MLEIMVDEVENELAQSTFKRPIIISLVIHSHITTTELCDKEEQVV